LQPTYVLKLGAPGKSAGLDIARRIGLDRELIDSARKHMSTTERDIASFLSELHARLDAAAIERSDLAAREREINLREQSLEVNWERKYAAKIQELEKRANELAARFEQRVEVEIGELSQKARARVSKTKREYRESLETSIGEIAPASRPKAVPKLKIEEGARVRLKGIRQPARVRRVLEHGMIEVDAGFMKMQVPETDVEEVLAAPGSGAGAKKPSITFQQGPSFDTPYREINVIGQRAEQAIEQVDKFLDSAALAQVERVRIVHGHGMGILKRAMAELLKDNPHVEKFYTAPPEQGGAGATVVELK
jgi:DNA mismatch repair protein MutS2